MARDACAGGQGHEIVSTLGIARGMKSNSTKGASMRGVGRGNVIKQLDVTAKFNPHGGVVRAWSTSDNRRGAERIRDAIRPGEEVEAADNFGNQRTNQKSGKAAKRKAVNIRAETLFDGANRAFNFTNVAVGSDDVDVDGGESCPEGAKFVVAVDIHDLETTGGVEFDHLAEFCEDGFGGTIRDGNGSAETDVTGDGVKETMVHYKKEIHA